MNYFAYVPRARFAWWLYLKTMINHIIYRNLEVGLTLRSYTMGMPCSVIFMYMTSIAMYILPNESRSEPE